MDVKPPLVAPNGNILASAALATTTANAARQSFGVICSTAFPIRQLQMRLKYSLLNLRCESRTGNWNSGETIMLI